MRPNGLLNWIIRRFMGKAITAGIEMAAPPAKPKSQMTPEERRQYREARQTARRARKAARLGRRLMR